MSSPERPLPTPSATPPADGQPDHDTGTPGDGTGGASPATAPAARIRSFVVRAGRMGTGQRRALQTLAPHWVLPSSMTADAPTNLDAVFGRHAPRIVEIGFGMGDATAQVAAALPDHDLLGIEVHPPGVGALLLQIEARALRNVRIVQDDAVVVLERMIAPASLAAIHVWFPDPWHKKRHHKRRLIQPALVALLAGRLAPGGYLHLATDWEPYALQMREVLDGEPLLRDRSGGAGFVPRPPWRPQTKFEQRGLRLGHGVRDLVYERIG